MDNNEKEIQQLKTKIAYYELVIHELSAPIIPSLIDDTILVPIAGPLSPGRLESIRTRVLNYCADQREVNCAAFDFTGVELKDLAQLDFNVFAIEISQLNAALKLMGIRPIYVGFNPQLVREIVQSGLHVEIETYATFKTALTILFNANGQSLHSV
ncbi:STAS domain-containing protein [Sporosarcina sp. YIM B06819]|uniref:STAS domain-containing protein n=1 Tax=Sporosarcina sp. YIM B06819 TaxID=3081769 RepID=UPI00298D2F43|nr:STAS domain-containing protein [Sporosarcina sp. YIM B06819]